MSMDATAADKRQRLAEVARNVAACTDCALSRGRTRAVPGEGNPDADIVFIGEGPGYYEDQQGRPFVGASGKFLDELLAGIGLDRRKVFITNVVKCRPPQNRDPQPDEIAACGKYLDEQLHTIAPNVVVTLGRHSMQRYFPGEAISRVHGQPRRKGDLIVVPMYHPAAALHQGNLRRVIEQDFSRLPDFLARALGDPSFAPAASPVPEHLKATQKPAPEPQPPVAAPPAATSAEAHEPQQMRLL
ncbi:MAG TPA: uracil-DNA glycosylase [Dehalococcoidia bacterium]|nr:uracil-DNA glycosylase [Dehalococcoidia bacterium]